jgi:hypothetical protein
MQMCLRCGVLVLLLGGCVLAAGVENGGFEQGLAGWTVMHAGTDDPMASYAVEDAGVHEGAKCLVYRKTAGRVQNTHVDQTVSVSPHTKYLVTAWVRTDGKLRPLLSIEGVDWRRLASRSAEIRSGWQEVRVCFDSGEREQVRVIWYGGSKGRPYQSFPGESALDSVSLRGATPEEIAELFPQPRTDTSTWFPYVYRWDEVTPAPALDFGLHDAPAGKHGFVEIRDGHLHFPNGERAKFWGVCVCGKSAFPTHEQADIVAARLAKCGINLVRLHALEGVLLDREAGSSRVFDEEMLDRMDYFADALIKRGIYLFMDWRTWFRVLPKDGLDPHDLYHWSMLDERFVKLNQDYARLLFHHRNPYTGRRYVDEPAVVAVEIINEKDLFDIYRGKRGQQPDVTLLKEALRERWNQWLVTRYGTRGKLAEAWTNAKGECGLADDEDPARGNVSIPLPADNLGPWDRDNTLPTGLSRSSDALLFLYELQTDYFLRMRAFLKEEIGIRVPISGSNWKMHIRPNARSNAQLDFTENHAYWDHAMPWPPGLNTYTESRQAPMVRNNPSLGDSGLIDQLGQVAVPGKPFIVTEWNFDNPNEYRSEGPLWMAAYGSLQDWDGLICYCFYGGWGRSWDQIGEYDERGMYLGSEEIFNDPALLALFPAASAVFLRGDVRPAEHEVHIGYSPTDSFAGQGSGGYELSHLRFLSYRHRVRHAFFDTRYEGNADVVVASGLSATGEYSQAKRAILYATTPLNDAYGKVLGSRSVVAGLKGMSAEPFPFPVASLPSGARPLLPEGGNCLGWIDDGRLVLPDASVAAKRDALWFRRLFAEASERWGLGRETELEEQIQSDTGELAWRPLDGMMTVRTPHAVGVTGFLAGHRVDVGPVWVEVENPFATVLAVSLDRKALGESRRILLTVVGRAENTDQVWSRNRTRIEPDGKGHAPVLAEPVVGRIGFGHAIGRAQALDVRGLPDREVAANARVLPLRAEWRTLHYLIER